MFGFLTRYCWFESSRFTINIHHLFPAEPADSIFGIVAQEKVIESNKIYGNKRCFPYLL